MERPGGGALRVVVLGPGALGRALGRRLAGGGVLVAYVGRAGLEPVAWPAGEPADLGLVLCKAYQTGAALAQPALGELDGPETIWVSLQNGLGNVEQITRRFDAERVLGGSTTHAARRRADGEVEHLADGDTRLAPVDEAGREAARRAAAWLGAAGVPAEVRGDLDALLWRKLCVSCAINPVTALLGVPNGFVATDPDARALAAQAAREAVRVALAIGVDLGDDALDDGDGDGDGVDEENLEAQAEARVLRVARATAQNRSSMRQDLEAGRRTEIDAVCGALVRAAQGRGLQAPWNEALWRLVRARSRSGARVGASG